MEEKCEGHFIRAGKHITRIGGIPNSRWWEMQSQKDHKSNEIHLKKPNIYFPDLQIL